MACNKQNTTDEWYSINNDIITISLDSNPTTGYQWEYIISDETILSCIETTYIPSNTNNEIVGSGGKWISKFKVIKDGITSLTFNYKRSWETEIADSKTINIEINDNKISII